MKIAALLCCLLTAQASLSTGTIVHWQLESARGTDVQTAVQSSRDTPQRCTVDGRAVFSEPLTGWWGEGLTLKLVAEGRFELEGSAYRWQLDSPLSARLELLEATVDTLGLGRHEEVVTPLGSVSLGYQEGTPRCFWKRSSTHDLPRGFPGLEIVSPDGDTVARFAFYQEDLVEPLSVLFLLDASGSMAGEPLRAAKAAIAATTHGLHSDTEFALIVHYDCSNIKAEYPFGDADAEFLRVVEQIHASGGTPLGDALVFAFDYLHKHAANHAGQRVLIALTDGAESCGVSPEMAVAGWDPDLAATQSFTMLGMSLTGDVAGRLQKIAESVGGEYEAVTEDTVGMFMKRSVPGRLTPRHGGADDR